MSSVAVDLAVGSEADAVPQARRLVVDALGENSAVSVDEVALVVTELVTNAVLHGRGAVRLRLLDGDAGVRVEVQDASSELPVLPRHSTDAMTGRGLALVARIASAWGVDPAPGGGKTVWAQVPPGSGQATDTEPEFDAELDVDALLAAFADDDTDLEPTFTVELGSVPTDLLLSAKSHIDNVVREFTLEAAGSTPAIPAQPAPSGLASERLPPELAELVATVVHGFSAARSAIKRQALAAARRGDREVRLSLTLPASAADAGEQYLAALDEADRYARNARLLTLETAPVHQVFRRWYVQTLVDQLRAAAAGADPPPAPTFPDMLGQALTRVAPLEAQAARLELLQKVTAELTGAGTVEDIARTVVRNATEALGAHNAAVYVLDGDDALRTAAVDGVLDADVFGQYGRIPVTPDLPAGAALLSGEPVVVRDRAELVRRFPSLSGAYDSELSLLVAPLIIGEHTLGALSLTFGGPARVEEQTQRMFVTTLADVTAQALERAMATSAATQAHERLRFLAEASVVLSSTLEYRTVLEAVAELVVPRIADWCSIQLLEDDQLRTVALAHVDPAKVAWAHALSEHYPADMSSPTGPPNVLRTGVSEHYANIPDELIASSAIDQEHLRLMQELGMSSSLVVPLTGRTGTFGTVTMITAGSGRRYDDGDVAFAQDLARRAALAVENAHAYREQSGRLASITRVAEAAQQAILAPPPPRIGPVALAARYVSAAAEALIGGDLYEVVRRPGAVRLLIGDVRGKGLEAVRTATVVLGEFRSAAADLDDLRDVAVQIDRRLSGYLAGEDFVTALIAEVRDDGSFSIASCGHPAPVLAAGGHVSAVEVVPTLPLGLGAAPSLTSGRLAPGDRLLLYTDGLVEARLPDASFVDFWSLVGPLGHGAPEEALDGLLARLRGAVCGDLGDDLALLLAEYRPE
ncbi:MAG: hypothetical protein JWN55_2386 [Frankiales bacterium]|nr:hypothetical protein [Frankiales bacterium]